MRAAALVTVSRVFSLKFSTTEGAWVISNSPSQRSSVSWRIWSWRVRSYQIWSDHCWNRASSTKWSVSITSSFIGKTEQTVRALSIVNFHQMSLKLWVSSKSGRTSLTVKRLNLSFTYEVSNLRGSRNFSWQKVDSIVQRNIAPILNLWFSAPFILKKIFEELELKKYILPQNHCQISVDSKHFHLVH